MVRMACRVVCGLSDMMAIFSPVSKFNRVDFPVFGRPTIVTNPDLKPIASSCLLYTSDAADDLLCVDLGGHRIIKHQKHAAGGCLGGDAAVAHPPHRRGELQR